MNFELTKYKIFLGKGALPPCNPRQGASPRDPRVIFLTLKVVKVLGTPMDPNSENAFPEGIFLPNSVYIKTTLKH